jgi:type IV pilus assembly protein PilW
MSEKGFTLVEILVAIVASLIVLGAIAATFIVQNKSYDKEEQVVDMQENVRAAIQILTLKLRMAGYDPTGSTGAGLVSAGSNSIQFTMDLNGDGDLDDTGPDEDITFALDTTDLQLTMDTVPVAENIQSLVFTYFDSSDNQLVPATGSPPVLSAVQMADVTRITIQLIAQTEKPDPDYPGGYRTRTLASDVLMRNLALSAAATTATTTVDTTTSGTTSDETTTTETTPEETTTTTTTSETTTTTTTTAATTTTEDGPTTTTTTEPADVAGPTIEEIVQAPSGGQIMNNRDVSVCADITDPSGVGSVALITDQDGSLGMTSEGGDTYCGTIPSHNNQFTTYYIIATDALDNRTQTTSVTYEQGTHF